jgi:hypothetical protein
VTDCSAHEDDLSERPRGKRGSVTFTEATRGGRSASFGNDVVVVDAASLSAAGIEERIDPLSIDISVENREGGTPPGQTGADVDLQEEELQYGMA